MAEKKLSILVELKEQVSAGLTSLQGMFDRLISSGNILSTVLGAAFGGAIAAGVTKLVEMFAEEEKTIVQLNAALRLSGQYSVEATTAIQQAAQRMQEQTVHSRDEALGVSARFAALARELTGEQLAEAQKLVIGYADATGKSVETATQLMVRAITTHVTHVRGLNVELDANATQQEKFNQINEQAGKLFEISAAMAKTLWGQIQQAKNEFADLERVLGQVIVEVLGLNVHGGTIRDTIHSWTENIRTNMGEWIKWGHIVVDAIMIVVESVKAAFQLAFNFGKVIGASIDELFMTLGQAVVDSINFIIDKSNKYLHTSFEEIHTDFFKNNLTIDQDTIATVDEQGQHLFDGVRKAWTKLGTDIKANPITLQPATVSGKPSTAGGGENFNLPEGASAQEQIRKMAEEQKENESAFKAGLITFDQYKEKIKELRLQAIELIPELKTLKDKLDLADVLNKLKGVSLGDTLKAAFGLEKGGGGEALQKANEEVAKMAEAFGSTLANAIGEAIAAHKSFGETVEKAVGKAAASEATHAFGLAIFELAAGFASMFINPAESAGHFKASATYGIAGAALASIAGATGGFSSSGGGGGAGGAASTTNQIANMAQNQVTINVPTMVTTDPRFVDWLMGTIEQASGRRVTVVAQSG